MTLYDFPLTGTLQVNPNLTPSFKNGDGVILLKDSIDPKDPKGNTRFLTKGEFFEIDQCGLSEYAFSKTKFTSQGEILERRKPLHSLNDIEWCIVDFETDLSNGVPIKAENCRLATIEDTENEENY